MVRSAIVAIGIYLVIVGLQGFVVEKIEWRRDGHYKGVIGRAIGSDRDIEPHHPWMFLTGGVVILMFSRVKASH